MSVSVRLNQLRKTFVSPDDPSRQIEAVKAATLDINPGELVTLLGPSGCGKTTLLRMIAGFEEPSSGDIWFGDRRMNDVAPNRRDATMVFQSYAIFPHLNVTENVAFGLKLTRLPKSEVAARVNTVIEQTGLTPYAKRAPSQLSGGQQQRVALARALVMQPKVLLFDEPLSNLDAKLRDQMRIEIRELQRRIGITSLYVTHDQIEAMSISDRIVIMNAGTVEQVGTPTEIYARPKSRFVAEFIGKANFLPAEVTQSGIVTLGGKQIEGVVPQPGASGNVTAMIRPEAIEIPAAGTSGPLPTFAARLLRIVFMGNLSEYLLEVSGLGEILVDIPHPVARPPHAVGDTVQITFNPASVRLLTA